MNGAELLLADCRLTALEQQKQKPTIQGASPHRTFDGGADNRFGR
jgi:hypothetical protein